MLLDLRKSKNYRDFLKSYYQFQKKKRSGWSYQVWAKQLGISGAALLLILQGKRNPSEKMALRFCQYFNFTHFEKEYFLDLIRLSALDGDPRLKKILLKKMRNEQPKDRVKMLTLEECEVLLKWHALAIRNAANLEAFCEDTKEIAEKLNFKVSDEDVTSAIEKLLKTNGLIRNKSGRLRVPEITQDVPMDRPIRSLHRYHEQQLINARQIHQKLASHGDLYEILGATLPIRLSRLKDMKDFMRRFKSEFLKTFDAHESGEEVYQLEMVLFPLTHYTQAVGKALEPEKALTKK